jgi:hypothetical protein
MASERHGSESVVASVPIKRKFCTFWVSEITVSPFSSTAGASGRETDGGSVVSTVTLFVSFRFQPTQAVTEHRETKQQIRNNVEYADFLTLTQSPFRIKISEKGLLYHYKTFSAKKQVF